VNIRRAIVLFPTIGLLLTVGACAPKNAALMTPSVSPGAVASAPSRTPKLVVATPSPSSSALARVVLPGDPNPALTPGVTNPAVTQATISTTICVSGYTATIRPPTSYTNKLKTQQIAQYGYVDKNLSDYEEDHLISLEIGGSPTDPRNLWPEPHTLKAPDGTEVGSFVKDRFENYLGRAVCKGSMSLVAAQRAIANDWVGNWEAAGRP
jgi:hypothetical protein